MLIALGSIALNIWQACTRPVRPRSYASKTPIVHKYYNRLTASPRANAEHDENPLLGSGNDMDEIII